MPYVDDIKSGNITSAVACSILAVAFAAATAVVPRRCALARTVRPANFPHGNCRAGAARLGWQPQGGGVEGRLGKGAGSKGNQTAAACFAASRWRAF